jgi:uncharacterized protein (TIGR02231 family)
MTACFWLVAGLACAQVGPLPESAATTPGQDARVQSESLPPPKPAASKIIEVTVYQGQALVTREVTVPAGEGTFELVVTPLPAQTVDSSLFTEGADGVRVLSTRFRTRAVKDDTRKEVRATVEQIKNLKADAQRLAKEIGVLEEDLKYLQKLGSFTGTALTGLTEKGRLDSESILAISKFLMENRGTKTKTETDIRRQLAANAESTEFATRQLAELSAGTSRVERDAVIVVHNARPQVGTVRLGYLVGAANWQPQYRLRGGAPDRPVRLEYLAAVTQQTGEPWPAVRITLSTARPSLDAAPPELLPLKMAVADVVDSGPIDAQDDRSQKIIEEVGPSREALMGRMGMTMEQYLAAGGARLNQEAASDQAEELRVADRQAPVASPIEKDIPSVTFPVAGRLDVPSRRDPQLLEVARVELPAEYYAKAVPVLTPRVYRLAKLTNKSEFVLLPGEATVYVSGNFVGRMRLPLVAAGEPFVAGFGVDSQLQVSRRLLRKSRSVQGGNQIFDYEFRIGLRNYRPDPVKVLVWDRLPKPQGEAVAVNLVKTSIGLSNDPPYQRTARLDNLLRWDVDVPQGTVGDKTLYLNYEFRLEYARNLPQPRFVSGGLREGPIGGGAMGGMGGMGGGMRSVTSHHE